MNSRYIYLGLLLVAAVAGFTACERVEEPCLQPRTAVMGIGVYEAKPNDTGVVIRDSALLAPVIGVLDSPFAFVYVPKPRTSKYGVMLSPLTDSTKFFVLTDTAKRNNATFYDTLTVYHTSKPAFLSTACGYANFFSVLKVTTTNHQIDSVRIAASGVTNKSGVEHVKVYY